MKRIADYEILRELGSGNGGSYWLARTPDRLGLAAETVAVKVLAAQGGGEAVRRMVAELRRFAAADGPHLVRFLDAGQEGATLFFSTEYHPHGSLGQQAGQLEPRTIIRAVADAARGVHALHERGLVHRNIRPSNVLLAGTDCCRRPAAAPPEDVRRQAFARPASRAAHMHHLLDDFPAPNHPLSTADPPPVAAPARITGPARSVLTDPGLAHVLAPGAIVTGLAPIETLAYVEPDLIRGHPAGRTTDIWGLAVTLHQALTGTTPFPDLPATDLGRALAHVVAQPPSVTIQDSRLAELVRWSLAPARSQRPATAAQFADALMEGVRP